MKLLWLFGVVWARWGCLELRVVVFGSCGYLGVIWGFRGARDLWRLLVSGVACGCLVLCEVLWVASCDLGFLGLILVV